MRIPNRSGVGILSLFIASAIASAQSDASDSELAAYSALISTPVGALPPMLSPGILGGRGGMGIQAQFGHMDESGDFSRRVFAVGLDLPAGRGRVGVVAGVSDYVCEDFSEPGFSIDFDCKKTIMGQLSGILPLINARVGDQGARFDIGLEGTAGFGTGDLIEATFDDGFTVQRLEVSLTGLSVTMGAPIALTVPATSFSIAPFITPRVGYGRATAEVTDSSDPSLDEKATEGGMRFLLGGGVALLFTSGLSLSLGFQKVFVDGGDATMGLGLAWNR